MDATQPAKVLDIGIVAHTTRLGDGQWLADYTEASYLSIDDGRLGCNGNHRSVWNYLSHKESQWAVVLEDDAIPVPHFLPQMHDMLESAPAPIVSLYLGTSRPPQYQQWMAQVTITACEKDACYILGPRLFHAVGAAIHTSLLPGMLSHISTMPMLPIDEAISHWAIKAHHQVAYCWPSLVDHRDGPIVANHRDHVPRTQPRKAWKVGGRDRWYPTVV